MRPFEGVARGSVPPASNRQFRSERTTAGLARGDTGRAGVATVVLFAFLLLAAGGSYLAWARWNAVQTDPTKVNLPAPRKVAATQTFMNGRGKPLRRFLVATDALPANSSKARCVRLANTTLASFPPPRRLAGLAASVPDPTLADALGNHLDEVLDYLDACGRGEDLTGAAEGARFTAVVVARQLKRFDG